MIRIRQIVKNLYQKIQFKMRVKLETQDFIKSQTFSVAL